MTAALLLGSGLLAEPHHDGSCVLERPDELGGSATVRLRVPRAFAVEDIFVRSVHDGEPRATRAVVDEETETETWWRATFAVEGPATRYRWLLAGGDAGYAWVNGVGVVAHDVADADDFVMTAGAGGPDWHAGSVVYEIFPDRFASSGLDVEAPEWFVPKEWGAKPTGRGVENAWDYYGGDLRGIEQRLDHLEQLGVNAIYLTPFFPAFSTHRYDSTTFDHVDSLLGGDIALRSLLAAAHQRGLRVVGDLTLNHTGVGHEWFEATERELYFFDDSLPYGYESWLGVPSLPKLNWSSPELRRRMLGVARRWLDFGLDGWRIDVANMAGRYREDDLTHDVARAVRSVLHDDSLLVAEHAHDFRGDLRGDGWHGTMNYSGFLRPVWGWLRRDELSDDLRKGFWGMPVGLPQLDGRQAAATMRAFRAGVPWESTLHSWTLLDSHDTARFRTVAGSRARHVAGIALQMTTPGVPMVFAGDELGLEGDWGEDARRTMPWDAEETWDRALLEEYRRLIALRRSSPALARGGIRYAHVDADAIAYLRETDGERLLVLVSRADHPPVRLPLAALGARELEPVIAADAVYADGDVLLPADGPAFHIWRLT